MRKIWIPLTLYISLFYILGIVSGSLSSYYIDKIYLLPLLTAFIALIIGSLTYLIQDGNKELVRKKLIIDSYKEIYKLNSEMNIYLEHIDKFNNLIINGITSEIKRNNITQFLSYIKNVDFPKYELDHIYFYMQINENSGVALFRDNVLILKETVEILKDQKLDNFINIENQSEFLKLTNSAVILKDFINKDIATWIK